MPKKCIFVVKINSIYMKKLFWFIPLIFLMLSSCSDDNNDNEDDPLPQNWKGDWNDPSDPNYKPDGYNPIEGEWLVTKRNNADFDKFVLNKFTDKFMWRQCLSEPESGKDPVYITGVEYMINNEAFMSKKDRVLITYRFNADSTILYITEKDDSYIMTRYERWDGYPLKSNPIEGEWRVISENGQVTPHFRIFNFSDKKVWIESLTYPILGSDFSYGIRGGYEINKSQFRVAGKVYSYTVGVNMQTNNKTLTIRQGNTTWALEPYTASVWKAWRGDWNNPSDANYKPEGYNPIMGKWNLISFDGKNWRNNKTVYNFSADFKWTQTVYNSSGGKLSETTADYIINDKAYNSGYNINQYIVTEEGEGKRMELTVPAGNKLTFELYSE